MKKKAKPVRLIKESVLAIKKDSAAYRGVAAGVIMGGESVIIIASSLAQLNVVWNKYHPGETLQSLMCHDVLVIPTASATLDEV